jgi:histidinol-phosphate/aromatic aminotransferase/cobyric acid decarboxylase-like protein
MGPKAMRVTIGLSEENERFIESLKKVRAEGLPIAVSC